MTGMSLHQAKQHFEGVRARGAGVQRVPVTGRLSSWEHTAGDVSAVRDPDGELPCCGLEIKSSPRCSLELPARHAFSRGDVLAS